MNQIAAEILLTIIMFLFIICHKCHPISIATHDIHHFHRTNMQTMLVFLWS